MIYRFVSLQEVIRKIYRNNPPNFDIPFSDMVEWIAEALELIGANPQYENKIADIVIEDYKGEIPCDLVGLYQIAKDDGRTMYLYSGTLATVPTGGSSSEFSNNFTDDTLRFIPTDEDHFPQISNSNNGRLLSNQFYISDKDIYVSFKSGLIRMSYLAIRLDCDGYPMIPDKEEYKQALVYQVQSMLDRQQWRAQKLPEAIYRDSESKWILYQRKAKAKARNPNLSQLENIKNMTVRLVPNLNSFRSFFNNLNKPEQLWNI